MCLQRRVLWVAMSPPDRREMLAVFAGGVVGAVARGLIAQALPVRAGAWPWATFAVNLAGAALLGYFVTRLQERLPLSAYRRPLLGTGFCGAFTTFSTMQLELVRMIDVRDYALAAGYAVASVALGYTAVFLASALTRRASLLP
jgi:fluoride exporter